MFRCFSVAVAALLAIALTGSQPAPQPQPGQPQPQPQPAPTKPVIAWHGQSFFTLTTTQGVIIAFDPHAIEEYGRMLGMRANIVLMSHNHPDHVQKGIFENEKEPGDKAPLVIPGWKMANGQETWNLIDVRFRRLGIHIRSVGCFHDDVGGLKRGINTIFIVEVDGWTICHLGDLGHKLLPAQLKAIGGPGSMDVLMIPCGGIYSLNGSEARDVLAQLKPKEYIFAMHIGTKIYDDLLPIDEFVDENPYPVAVVREDQVIVNKKPRENASWLRKESPKSDNSIVLERGDDRPHPVIVGLHYWPQEGKKKKDDGKEKEKEKDKDKDK
jgi:L-ascorbate metabolism protein UlaG (beta-lactamase superfamily)